jgi:hypothetical protein
MKSLPIGDVRTRMPTRMQQPAAAFLLLTEYYRAQPDEQSSV